MAQKYVPYYYKIGKNPLSMTYDEYMTALKVTRTKSAWQKQYHELMREKL